MPIEFHYNDNGTWRKMNEMHYNDASTWRELDAIWYNDQGDWKQVFTNKAVSLTNWTATGSRNTTAAGVQTATGAYQVQADGTAAERVNTNSNTDSTTVTGILDNWWTGKPQAGVGNDYEVRATQTGSSSGGIFSGTLDTWEDISVTREWELTDSCNFCEANESRTLLIEIRDALTQTVQDSAVITLRTNLFGP